LRPRLEHALAAGSALHAQALRIDQQDAHPRPVPRAPSTASTAADAFVEALGLGPLKGVDLAWASLHRSSLWLAEHAPTRDLAAQRQHTLYLHELQRAHHAVALSRHRKTALRRGLDPEQASQLGGRARGPGEG
jgi:hypothetical protein